MAVEKRIVVGASGASGMPLLIKCLESLQDNEEMCIRDSTKGKKKFSVSMQHYSFAVKAFVELVKQFGMDEYELSLIHI